VEEDNVYNLYLLSFFKICISIYSFVFIAKFLMSGLAVHTFYVYRCIFPTFSSLLINSVHNNLLGIYLSRHWNKILDDTISTLKEYAI
jgi:hypothetical protein